MLKTCLYCNNEFTTNREKAKYCCDAHRVADYRNRKGIVTRKERTSSICQREGCERTIPESSKATAKYCSNACRQKVYHAKEVVKKKAKLKYRNKQERKRIKEEERKSAEVVEEFIQELMGE